MEVIQLRGRGKKASLAFRAARKPSDNNNCMASLPLASGDLLRLATCYSHLGTIAVPTESSAQDLAHCRASAQAAEKAQTAIIRSSANVPYKCKLLVVTATHARRARVRLAGIVANQGTTILWSQTLALNDWPPGPAPMGRMTAPPIPGLPHGPGHCGNKRKAPRT